MARTREVGTLWIGGPLSWMEQLCLKSFVERGQTITLFSYEDIPNVPNGVIRRDGREVLDTDDFIKYEQKNSFALFADWFRLHMIKQNPGMIWVDTDVYCARPMDYDSDYIFGYELPGSDRVNNAVLGAPADSPLLAQMLAFTSDRYSIAEFLPKGQKAKMRRQAERGKPVHITQQPWGVWGPMMLTHFVHANGLSDKVQPLNAFYPVTFRDRTTFMRRAALAEGLITDETTALHLWASNKRQLGNFHAGLPPPGSYFEKLVRAHDINPHLAPIKGRGSTFFDGGLIDSVQAERVDVAADVTGQARSFLLALHHKFDCDLHLMNCGPEGLLEDGDADWLSDYLTFLTERDVPNARIKIIRDPNALRPVDVLCNLSGFGDQFRVQNVQPIFEKCLHSDTEVFMDVRKGSGAFPFLRSFGTNSVLSTQENDGTEVSRIRLTPQPPAPPQNESGWAEIAQQLAGQDGWYRPGPDGHSLLYTDRGSDTLVVTFDNLDIAMTKREDRRPWGFNFIETQGWSMLGVLAGGWTWYREPWVCEQFDDLQANGFFSGFKRVVFYGASMGGYAACAFSPAAPGCDVVAISPQSTVDKTIVPWETRYKAVWGRDFSGKYGDAAKVSSAAGQVSILYDPYEPLDAQHAARFTSENVQASARAAPWTSPWKLSQPDGNPESNYPWRTGWHSHEPWLLSIAARTQILTTLPKRAL